VESSSSDNSNDAVGGGCLISCRVLGRRVTLVQFGCGPSIELGFTYVDFERPQHIIFKSRHMKSFFGEMMTLLRDVSVRLMRVHSCILMQGCIL
jgi:hypothetical protein